MRNVLFLLLGLASTGQAKSSCARDSDCLSNEVCARPIGSDVDHCLPVSLPEEGDTFTRRLNECSNGDIGEPGSPACEGDPPPFHFPPGGRKLKLQGETLAGDLPFELNPFETASGTPVN